MEVHWPSMTMAFMAGNIQVILKGNPSLMKAERSLKTLTKTWNEDDQGFLTELQNADIEIENEYVSG